MSKYTNSGNSSFSGMINWDDIYREVASFVPKEYREVAYRYLRDHAEEFQHWYLFSDHLEYADKYWMLENIDLDEYRKKLAKK